MESGDYKKISWPAELLITMLIVIEAVFILQHGALQENIAQIIVQVMIYLLLSFIFYYSLSPAVLFSKPGVPINLKQKEITQDEQRAYINKSVLFISLLKLSVLSGFPLIYLSRRVFGINSFFPAAFVLAAVFYCLIMFTKYLAFARGYMPESFKDIIVNIMFYYNPDDKRAVVNKPIGIGSTINLANKQGKIILATIISIPLSIILLLLLVFALSDRL